MIGLYEFIPFQSGRLSVESLINIQYIHFIDIRNRHTDCRLEAEMTIRNTVVWMVFGMGCVDSKEDPQMVHKRFQIRVLIPVWILV